MATLLQIPSRESKDVTKTCLPAQLYLSKQEEPLLKWLNIISRHEHFYVC